MNHDIKIRKESRPGSSVYVIRPAHNPDPGLIKHGDIHGEAEPC